MFLIDVKQVIIVDSRLDSDVQIFKLTAKVFNQSRKRVDQAQQKRTPSWFRSWGASSNKTGQKMLGQRALTQLRKEEAEAQYVPNDCGKFSSGSKTRSHKSSKTVLRLFQE